MPSKEKATPKIESEVAFIEPPAPDDESIPQQKEHFQLPTRFGAVPVDEAPLGWEVQTRRSETKVTKFQHAYPTIQLPFQEVQRVEFGHNDQFLAENEKNQKLRDLFPTGANRLFFGDNLHIMRQLPSASIDLIYIDPPFFSGRNYNVIFGDKNEMRSFSDIWEGGMPGYLVWLNVRLFEMKRLLKPTGSIYIHLDWHASHYVKVEMDKIFGYENFLNEIVWCYEGHEHCKSYWNRKHDVLLYYAKDFGRFEDFNYKEVLDELKETTRQRYKYQDEKGFYTIRGKNLQGSPVKQRGDLTPEYEEKYPDLTYRQYATPGVLPRDWWIIQNITSVVEEKIGYPTQKPETLLERIIKASSHEGEVVADFFNGGGTTPTVAQRLNRRWVACDQSRIAVAITADRVAKMVDEKIGALFPVPDFTVEHWGIYEAPKLETYSPDKFREFVVKAFGGRTESVSPAIHGVRYGIPLYVGEPSRRSRIGKDDVARFAKAVYEERRANHGVMLGWNFGQDARKAAEILAARENKRIDFVRLNLVRLEDDEYREHVVNKSKDYGTLLNFIQPPEIRVAVRRIKSLTYEFDVSDSISLNKDGTIANVQWDFDHKTGRFTSTRGYSFLRDKKSGRPVLVVEYEFPKKGKYTIACSVQDDQGGEQTVMLTIEVN